MRILKMDSYWSVVNIQLADKQDLKYLKNESRGVDDSIDLGVYWKK